MKKIMLILAVAALTGSATLAFAGLNAGTGVNLSLHDMNVNAGAGLEQDELGRVCVFCHTPHNAITDANDTYPLWNHTLPATDDWTSYEWATPLNSSLDTAGDPLAGPSRLCMSCHDGVIAIDQHGTALPNTGVVKLGAPRAIGLGHDLTDDHPIGFSYDAAVAARNVNGADELVAKTERFASTFDAAAGDLLYNEPVRAGKRTIENVLYNGVTLTCASCHDVHNKDNVAPSVNTSGSTQNFFLWADEANSLICLSCHKK